MNNEELYIGYNDWKDFPYLGGEIIHNFRDSLEAIHGFEDFVEKSPELYNLSDHLAAVALKTSYKVSEFIKKSKTSPATIDNLKAADTSPLTSYIQLSVCLSALIHNPGDNIFVINVKSGIQKEHVMLDIISILRKIVPQNVKITKPTLNRAGFSLHLIICESTSYTLDFIIFNGQTPSYTIEKYRGSWFTNCFTFDTSPDSSAPTDLGYQSTNYLGIHAEYYPRPPRFKALAGSCEPYKSDWRSSSVYPI